MRMSFDVHGKNQDELEAEARRIIEAFTDKEPTFVTITAEPIQSAQNGTVLIWRGDVEAQV